MTRRVSIRQSEIAQAIKALLQTGERGVIEVIPEKKVIRILPQETAKPTEPKRHIKL